MGRVSSAELARERVAYKRYLRSLGVSFNPKASTKELRRLVRQGRK